MKTTIKGWYPPTYCEPWPAARLILIAALFALWGKARFAWGVATLPEIGRTAKGMLGVMIFCGLLSRRLGALYVALVVFPFYATAVLNEWLYRGGYWTFRTLLRLLYDRRVSALVALLAELGLFLALWEFVTFLLKRYCI